MIAFFVGIITGCIFALCRLPIPAPPTLSGVAGIVGIFLGYLIIKKLRG